MHGLLLLRYASRHLLMLLWHAHQHLLLLLLVVVLLLRHVNAHLLLLLLLHGVACSDISLNEAACRAVVHAGALSLPAAMWAVAACAAATAAAACVGGGVELTLQPRSHKRLLLGKLD
jgi:hypothetical protein